MIDILNPSVDNHKAFTISKVNESVDVNIIIPLINHNSEYSKSLNLTDHDNLNVYEGFVNTLFSGPDQLPYRAFWQTSPTEGFIESWVYLE